MFEWKQPPPAAPTTRSSSKAIQIEATWSTPGKDHVAPITLDDTMAGIRSETFELEDTTIERSQATTHELIMSQFEILSASFGQPRGQPTQPPQANKNTYCRGDRSATSV
jgi:hypothetical protein